MQANISEPDEVTLEGCVGRRYWVQTQYPLSLDPTLQARLTHFPVAIFQPNRSPGETPVVVALQGMAAPYEWNAFLVPTLLGMGIACVLFDTPLAGQRSFDRSGSGNVLREATALVRAGGALNLPLVSSLVETVASDIGTVLECARERHGLADSRVALFGVSLGALLTAHAFTRLGIGSRLLGAIGHADLPAFARSYAPCGTQLATSLLCRGLGKIVARWYGPAVPAALDFLWVLRELARGRAPDIDPMTYAERVSVNRRVRFLVGADDVSVRPVDAVACARRFPDGECYVVPGLRHGTVRFGPTFVEHVRTFLDTQLGDWKR